MQRIAVFPIPNMVVFPGHDVHLHVFEPRYRKMVQDCVSDGIELGVVLPKRRINIEPKRSPKDVKRLHANQDSFEPNRVLCCGRVELIETLDDGRMLIAVDAVRKVAIKEIVQSVPYYVATVEELSDHTEDEGHAASLFAQLEFCSQMLLAENYPDFEATLPATVLEDRKLNALVSEVLKWFIFRADLRQEILEKSVVEEKAASVIALMREYLSELGMDQNPTNLTRATRDEVNSNVIHVDFSTPKSPVKQ